MGDGSREHRAVKTPAAGRHFGAGVVPPASLALLSGLIGLGLFQVASFAYFLKNSRDFLLARAETSTAAAEIAIPGEVFLGLNGCFACLRSGWGGPSGFGVMAQRRDAVLALRLPATARSDGRDLVLVLDAAAFVPEVLGQRRLSVLANGTPIAELEFPPGDPRTERFIWNGESVLHRIVVPHAVVVQSPILLLTLQMAVASPRQLGLGADPRPMGIAVRSVALSSAGDDGAAAPRQ
jgi:hypothetical protein